MNRYKGEISHAVLKGIGEVIDGMKKGFECRGVTPEMIKTHMEKHKYETGDLETNGWEYDWWLKFTKAGKSFTASGSGYYGWFAFSPTEE